MLIWKWYDSFRISILLILPSLADKITSLVCFRLLLVSINKTCACYTSLTWGRKRLVEPDYLLLAISWELFLCCRYRSCTDTVFLNSNAIYTNGYTIYMSMPRKRSSTSTAIHAWLMSIVTLSQHSDWLAISRKQIL